VYANARRDVAVCPLPDASGVPEGGAWGVVCDAATREPVPGVTIVVAGKNTSTSDEGVFYLPVDPGDHEIDFYYGECMIRGTVHVVAGPTSPVQQSLDLSRC
jgi:hypothetical protein